jgi:hypothetical protein
MPVIRAFFILGRAKNCAARIKGASQQTPESIIGFSLMPEESSTTRLSASDFSVRVAGEVAEWSIATVLKTVGPKGPGGSNPSLSAIFSLKAKDSYRSRDENRFGVAKRGRNAPRWPKASQSLPLGHFAAILH